MNTVEGILLEIGESLVMEHRASKPLLLYLNSVLKELLTEPIDGNVSGFVVLALIYTLNNESRQKLVLSKVIKVNAEEHNRYTFILTMMTVIIVVIVMFMATKEVATDGTLNDGSIDVLKIILYNLFELVKHLLGASYPVPA